MAHCLDPHEWDTQEEQEFICVLCDSKKGKLRFLRCLHSCCDDCLQKTGASILCPVCDTKTDNRGSHLPVNCLQEISRMRSQLAEPKICFMCKLYGKSNIGTFVCLACDNSHLCDQCVKTHKVQPTTKTHKPTALKELFSGENGASNLTHTLPPCPEHHTAQFAQPLKFYCETCSKHACQDCLTLDHRDGSHKIVTVAKAAEKKIAVFDQEIAALEPIKEKILHGIQSLENMEGIQILQKEQLVNEVNDQVFVLKEMIDAMGAEYIADIASTYDDLGRSTRDMKTELKKRKERIDNAISVVQACKSMCSATALVNYQQPFSECLTLAAEGAERKIIHNEMIFEKPRKSVNPEEFKDMIGQLKIQEYCSSVEDNNGILDDQTVGSHIPDVIGQLEDRKQVEVKIVTKVDLMEGITYIDGLDITHDGDILVAGTNCVGHDSCIKVLTFQGMPKPPIEFNIQKASQMTLSGENIYIGNRDNECVTVMNKQGTSENMIKAAGKLSRYIGVTVDEERVYFTSYNQHKLYSCLKSANEATEWAPAVKLKYPSHLCCTARGDIAVSNHGSHSICLINKDEQLIFTYGTFGDGDGQLNCPNGICSDSQSRIYIADHHNHRISFISASGQFITNVITQQHGIYQPRDVKVWNDLLVVAHSGSVVTVFKLVA